MKINRWFYEKGYSIEVKKGMRSNKNFYYVKKEETNESFITNSLEALQKHMVGAQIQGA